MLELDKIREILLRECRAVGGMPNWAKRHKVPVCSVHNFVYGHRPPTPMILRKLRMERVTIYRYLPKTSARMKQGRAGTIYGEADV